nr:expressed protein [Hymenolepis microstoma]
MVERQYLEYNVIVDSVNLPIGRLWFRVNSRNENYLYLDILPVPRGHVTLYAPPAYPNTNPIWSVMIGEKRVCDRQFQYPVQAKTMLQAFVACAYVVSKHLNIELPADITQIDPLFFQQLNALLPADYVQSILSLA